MDGIIHGNWQPCNGDRITNNFIFIIIIVFFFPVILRTPDMIMPINCMECNEYDICLYWQFIMIRKTCFL